jgi:uncharacterized protein involved in outer membrane biogenesis
MKKALKWIAIGIGVLLTLLVAGLTLFGGALVKGAVNGLGPAVVGVPVTLEKATFRPLAGEIKLTGLHVGNPPGFKTPALFDLGEVDVRLDVRSLFKDTLVIRKIVVIAPHITYERGLLDSNFGALGKRIQGGAKGKEEATESEPRAKDSGGKVIIDELVVVDPTLNVSVTAAGGHSIPVKLGRVELRNIGREGGGVTFSDAFKIVFSVIASNVENAVLGAGELIGSGVKAVGSGAKAVGGAVADGAVSVAKGVGGLLRLGEKNEGGRTQDVTRSAGGEKPATAQ